MLDSIVRIMQPEAHTIIQMDNAPPHTGHHNLQRLNAEAAALEISYEMQPAQSPDFNICDLSIFNSLQKRVNHLKSEGDRTLLTLWDATEQVYNSYPPPILSICFGHLYANYNQCLMHQGGNEYPSPHAHVRQNYERGLSLRKCCLTMQEYNQKREEVAIWKARNEI